MSDDKDLKIKELETIVNARMSEVLALVASPPWLCDTCVDKWNKWAEAIISNSKAAGFPPGETPEAAAIRLMKKRIKELEDLKERYGELHLAVMSLGQTPSNSVGDIDGIFDKVNSSFYSLMNTEHDLDGNPINHVLVCVVCGSPESSGGHYKGCPVGIIEDYVHEWENKLPPEEFLQQEEESIEKFFDIDK